MAKGKCLLATRRRTILSMMTTKLRMASIIKKIKISHSPMQSWSNKSNNLKRVMVSLNKMARGQVLIQKYKRK